MGIRSTTLDPSNLIDELIGKVRLCLDATARDALG